MSKLWTTILIILACSIFAFAQTETPTEPDWTTFAPEGEEFSLETPIALNASISQSPLARNAQVKNEADENRRYLNKLNGTYFYIFSDNWKTPEQYKFVLKFAYDSNQLETTQKSGELTTVKFEFFDNSNFYHTILAVNGKNRIYVFQTVSPTKDNQMVERFFGSIKFDQKPLFENSPNTKTKGSISVTIPASTDLPSEPASNEETIVTVKRAPVKEPEVKAKTSTDQPEVKAKTPANEPVVKVKNQSDGNGLGNGNGDGQGFGIGNGRGNKTETENNTAPTKITSAVRVLSKPRANYTDYARFYEIQGKIMLRVTFSANGSIGGITPISKLPFGLTEEAIKAARGIRFEPAMKESVPYSVTKPVEYTFTIY